jgi:hypothetical protein
LSELLVAPVLETVAHGNPEEGQLTGYKAPREPTRFLQQAV